MNFKQCKINLNNFNNNYQKNKIIQIIFKKNYKNNKFNTKKYVIQQNQ